MLEKMNFSIISRNWIEIQNPEYGSLHNAANTEYTHKQYILIANVH